MPVRNHAQSGGCKGGSRSETRRQRRRARAHHGTLEEVLAHSGYVHARTEGSTRMKIRRLIRRLQLNAHDAEVWLGMLRQILWKLDSKS